jgi:hypothetical protein
MKENEEIEGFKAFSMNVLSMEEQPLQMITVGISLSNKDKLMAPSIRQLDWDLINYKNSHVEYKNSYLYILEHYNHFFMIFKVHNFRKKVQHIKFEAHLDAMDMIIFFGSNLLLYLDMFDKLVLVGFGADYTKIKFRK